MDNTTLNLCLLIRALAAHRNLANSTVSRLVTGSGDTLKRLEKTRPDGTACHRISTQRVAASFERLSQIWPADLEWPRDIPRPPKSRKDAA